MAVWSLDRAVITAGGRTMTGFGESDALSYKYANDDWEPVDCCDGDSVYNKKLSKRGEISLTLRYDSTSLRDLATLADAGESFSFNAVFANGRAIEAGECYVLKRPEPTYGARTSDEVWVLSAATLEVEYEQGGDT